MNSKPFKSIPFDGPEYYKTLGYSFIKSNNLSGFARVISECKTQKIFPSDFLYETYLENRIDMFRLLVKDKNWPSEFITSFFYQMIMEKQRETKEYIQPLLESGRVGLFTRLRGNKDAMFLAGKHGRTDLIDMFMAFDPDAHFLSGGGMVVGEAAVHGYWSAALYLLDKGAPLNNSVAISVLGGMIVELNGLEEHEHFLMDKEANPDGHTLFHRVIKGRELLIALHLLENDHVDMASFAVKRLNHQDFAVFSKALKENPVPKQSGTYWFHSVVDKKTIEHGLEDQTKKKTTASALRGTKKL